ncbi:SDR family oxidoreductase [Streptomyces sp. NPDC037389]|uniref:SDR family NAD(P)-dependent oxidoreductase n=1 Tax=Streptomyces sp. NPDC037389 TaxID=3155369 RepID=UPI0033FCB563
MTVHSGGTGSTTRGVVVTGAGTGIGRATARAFAEQGAGVLVVGRTGATLAGTAEGLPGVTTLTIDITDPKAPELVVGTALRAFGRLDVLVNNAAAMGYRPLATLDRRSAEEQLRTNLLAPVLLTRRALDALAEHGGTVVNVGSSGALGLRSWPDNGLYGATKAALDFLTRTWAVELAPRGIRVVGVAPGVVDTGAGARMGLTEEQYAGFLREIGTRVPSGRVGRPEEIAWWITRLTRPEAAYANGVVLPVDGGLSLT